jgi:hypothetical protein
MGPPVASLPFTPLPRIMQHSSRLAISMALFDGDSHFKFIRNTGSMLDRILHLGKHPNVLEWLLFRLVYYCTPCTVPRPICAHLCPNSTVDGRHDDEKENEDVPLVGISAFRKEGCIAPNPTEVQKSMWI